MRDALLLEGPVRPPRRRPERVRLADRRLFRRRRCVRPNPCPQLRLGARYLTTIQAATRRDVTRPVTLVPQTTDDLLATVHRPGDLSIRDRHAPDADSNPGQDGRALTASHSLTVSECA